MGLLPATPLVHRLMPNFGRIPARSAPIIARVRSAAAVGFGMARAWGRISSEAWAQLSPRSRAASDSCLHTR